MMKYYSAIKNHVFKDDLVTGKCDIFLIENKQYQNCILYDNIHTQKIMTTDTPTY